MDEKARWQVETSHASGSRFKKFAKNHELEYISLFANLERIQGILNGGNKLGSFQVGCFRSEGDGLYRIGQTGVPSAKESRLYVFPEEETLTIYVLGIGTKETQDNDINEAKKICHSIKANNVNQTKN